MNRTYGGLTWNTKCIVQHRLAGSKYRNCFFFFFFLKVLKMCSWDTGELNKRRYCSILNTVVLILLNFKVLYDSINSILLTGYILKSLDRPCIIKVSRVGLSLSSHASRSVWGKHGSKSKFSSKLVAFHYFIISSCVMAGSFAIESR